MKSVFVAGSRKYYKKIEDLVHDLNEKGIKTTTTGKCADRDKDTKESEDTALLNAFRRIDEFDICYIVSTGGYVGKTVSIEMRYAKKRNKELIASEEIPKNSTRVPVSTVMTIEELVEYCQSSR